MDTPTVPLRARKDGWTPARQRDFLSALAETGSVPAAAEVGMSKASVYKLRQRPDAAAFRAAWNAALAQVWQQAGPTMLDRVINGEVHVLERDGATITRRRPCSTRLLIRALDRAARLKAASAIKVHAEKRPEL